METRKRKNDSQKIEKHFNDEIKEHCKLPKDGWMDGWMDDELTSKMETRK
jgi:hypothetical protein